jgi:SAM-dependent methyltransferase
MGRATRWVTDTSEGHSEWYISRFRTMAEEGADLAGEARLVDAMLPRGARVLDAGCGTGRVGAVLDARGHTVVGVDADPALVDAARADHPGPRWLVADLAELDLGAAGETEPFDAAVLAGNVMVFVAPGTEAEVLHRVGAHVVADGFVIVGFHVDRNLPLDEFDRAVAAAGLVVEHRFATWDLRAWHDDADFAVTVLRHAPAGAGSGGQTGVPGGGADPG